MAVVEKVNSDGTIMISESSYKIDGVTEGIRFRTRDNLSDSAPDNYGDSFMGYIYLGNFGGEVLSGNYKGLNWSVTKQGVLTISGKATEPITNKDHFYGWIYYMKDYNDIVITKIIVDIPSGENLYSLAKWFDSDYYSNAKINEITFKNIDTRN